MITTVPPLSVARHDAGNARKGTTNGLPVCRFGVGCSNVMKRNETRGRAPITTIHNPIVVGQVLVGMTHYHSHGRNVTLFLGIHVITSAIIGSVVTSDQCARTESSITHPLHQRLAPEIQVHLKLCFVLLRAFTTCASVSSCIAITANLWLCLAGKDSLPLATLVTCGVLLPRFLQFRTTGFVVSLFVTNAASDCPVVTHVFTLPLGGSSLASDYIIASFGSAVNHYLSFNKRGATALQVLLPRQLFTQFAPNTIPLRVRVSPGFRIVIESTYLY